ncbi:hypothetical protein DPMN_161517 [Dreissena polymorpha]|uniref:Uncharacterized protein n=1 Tax=Dreissena polymorpha TaxID=45954 RepID=A0A9D4IR62_DREPO|nr:hypothetical protein DPMN_161517 [Dreissena polymorpha]
MKAIYKKEIYSFASLRYYKTFYCSFLVFQVTLYDIDWTCTCEDLTWLDDVIDTNVTLRGDLMCSNDPGKVLLDILLVKWEIIIYNTSGVNK